MRKEKPNAYDHPLWTTSHLLERAGSRTTASQQLRNQLRRQMLALSTYTLTEPPMLIDIRQEASAKRLKELRDRAESDGAWQALAEEYDKENQALKQRAAELEDEIGQLQAQVDNLNLAVRYQNINADEQEIPPESEPVILSLADAVDAAMHRFSADLVLGGDVNRGIEGLAEDAGPPDKVFEHLKLRRFPKSVLSCSL